jgi:site-specific DNA recombinase
MVQQGTKHIGIWVRVSTEDQVRGESPEHHHRRAEAYAQAKGWEVVEVYRLEAVSGKAVMHHPEAQRMLADVRAGRIEALVFSKLARLARNTRELLEFSEIFRSAGADLVSLQESIDTSTPAGRLFFTMIAAMAQWEREEIVERVRASVPIRAQLGKSLGGQAPFGYRRVEGKLELDPEEAPIRRLVFELFAEHKSRRGVAKMLNQRGYRTRKGSQFTDTTVWNFITDPIAKGTRRTNYTSSPNRAKRWDYKPESEWVLQDVDPLIPLELWETCQRIIAEKRVKERPMRRTVHLFAGIALCACGTKMYVRSNSPKYVCDGCRNKIPIMDLEAVFREQLHSFLVSPDEISEHAAAAQEAIRDKERLLEICESELRRLATDEDRLFDLFNSAALSKDDFARRHGPLSERRRQIEEELPTLQAELDVLRISELSREEALLGARDLFSRWEDMDPPMKREIVEAITDRIVIGKDEVAIDLLHLPVFGSSDHDATKPQGFWAAISCTRAG